MSEIKEGHYKKGGLNNYPSAPKPNITPLPLKGNNKWVSVKDKLPAIHTRVLAFVDGRMEVAFYDLGPNDVDMFWDRKEQSIFHYVSHWMPLPKPPKDD